MDSVLTIVVLFTAYTHDSTHHLPSTLIDSGVYSSVIADTGKCRVKSDYFGKESILKCI